jgi:RNA-directed DNA polymerase
MCFTGHPDRRFHALFDRSTAGTCWTGRGRRCAATAGAAGIDRVSLADVGEYGVSRLLGELAAELRERRYRPLLIRRHLVSGELAFHFCHRPPAMA